MASVLQHLEGEIERAVEFGLVGDRVGELGLKSGAARPRRVM
jgi:hypothetical protein